MKIHFLGVRGSTPAPGAAFVRYGGHTSCVAVSHDDAEQPSLLLDAGTGIRRVSELVSGPACQASILLSHLHWDHVQGLPFFTKGDHPQAQIELYLPAQDHASGRDLLAGLLSPPYFPIRPEGLQGDWRFHTIEPGVLSTAGFEVDAFEVEHKGGRTYGYRVSDGSGSLAYLPDHAAVSRPGAFSAHIAGVDILIHDSQFTEAEREVAGRFGHATVNDSVELAVEAGAGRLVLFHHGPARTDAELDAIGTSVPATPETLVAHEGMTLFIGGGT